MWALLAILLTLVLRTDASVNVRLKGGLIYKNEGSAQINQDTLTFKRNMDVKALYSVAQKLQDSTSMYQSYCTMVSNKYKQSKQITATQLTDEDFYSKMKNLSVTYISTTLKYPLVEAQSVCARLNARPVEIRDIYTYNAVIAYANERNIQQIFAGIVWSPKLGRFQFMTDHAPAKMDQFFNTISYGGSYFGSDHAANWEKDSYLLSDAPNYPLIYRNPAKNFQLRLADKYEKMHMDLVMCEKDFVLSQAEKSETRNMFMAVADHSCRREIQSVLTQTKYTLSEIRAITTLNFTYTENTDWTQYYPEFEPLSKKDELSTFWYNADPTNRTRRSPQAFSPLHWPSDDDDHATFPQSAVLPKPQYYSPFLEEFNAATEPSTIYHPEIYKAPKGFWSRSSLIKKMPYEDMQIVSDVPSTIPDFIILLHSIWKIEIEKQYHSESFEAWMADQAKRVELYTLLRRFPLIHRVERSLQATLDTEREMHKMFQEGNNSLSFFLLERIAREIKTIEEESVTNFNLWSQNYNKSITLEEENELKQDNSIQAPDDNAFFDAVKDHLSRVRVRRVAPLVAAAAAAAAGAAGGIAGYAISKALHSGSSSGLTQNEIAILRRHALEMTDLRIDSKQHAMIINNLSKRLQFFEAQIIGNFEGTLAMTIGTDLRSIIQQLQTVTQVTVLKYNAALLAAASGKTSPYVLSQEDLNEIVQTAQRDKAMTLTSDTSLVTTIPTFEKNRIIFLFSIPIIDANKEFTIYTVTPLPIFLENGTYMPNMDSNHIAIHNRGDKFTTLTELQLASCLDKPPRCQSNTAITPIQNGISCVAMSYTTDSQMCPLTLTTTALVPRFYFFDEHMFYSTPAETKVFMICTPPPGQLAQPDTTLKLTGYGQFDLLPSCTLTMPDGTTHHTPNKPVNATLYDKPLFREITQEKMPERDKVMIDNSPYFSLIAKATQTFSADEPVGTFTDRMIKSFDPATVTANTGTTVVIILAGVAIGFLCYFCYYKRLCDNCCKKRRASHDLDKTPPRFNDDPVDIQWFREDGPNEPDTISSIAAATRTPPSRHVSFGRPFRHFNAAFPRWIMGSQPIPTSRPLRTTEQMTNDQLEAMHTYNDTIAREQLASLQGAHASSLPPSTRIHNQIYRPSEHEKSLAEQERLLQQHQQDSIHIHHLHGDPTVTYTRESETSPHKTTY